jgi:uncharacterized protein YbjT (DUF2867 family)
MILITGANSPVGQEIARQLLEGGEAFRLFLRDPASLPDDLRDKAGLVAGDFARAETLPPALEGVDRVYLTSFDHPDTVSAQRTMIDAAKSAGVERIVRLSAPAADPDSPVNFAGWHGRAEKILEQSGLAYTHLRPNWYMQNFFEYAAGGVIRLPVAEAGLSLIDARDIAAAAVAALTEPGHAGKTYDLTGPEALTHGEVARMLSDATGKRFRFKDQSLADYERQMTDEGKPDWWIIEHVDLFQRILDGENAGVTDDVARVTGRPAIAFAAFARDYAERFRSIV